jgi:hypothetical protein
VNIGNINKLRIVCTFEQIKAMTRVVLKKKLTKAINEIDDTEFLQALHTIIAAKQEDAIIYGLTVAQKRELDKRKANHLSGKTKSYTWAEVKKTALKKRA